MESAQRYQTAATPGGKPETLADIAARAVFLPVESRMWWSTVWQLFEELVPIGNVDRERLLEQCEQSLRNCCVLAGPLQFRDGLALNVDVPLSALNVVFGFLKMSMQERSLYPVILTTSGQRWPVGGQVTQSLR